MSRQRIRWFTITVFLGLHCLAPRALASARDSGRASQATILLTHPQASVLNYYVQLVRAGVLDVTDLHIKGIYHEAEEEDYQEACAYLLREEVAWISLERIQCDLPLSAVYQRNNCSSAFEALLAGSAGLILSGGPDLPPELYNHPTGPTTLASAPARHRFEVSLAYHLLGQGLAGAAAPDSFLARRPAYAVIGLCGGMQCMNVATGGTLTQDIPSDIYGANAGVEQAEPHAGDAGPGSGAYHAVKFVDTAPAALRQALVGERDEAPVLSIHHQAIETLGEPFEAIATTRDGLVIEGIAHTRYPHVMGWQFHPELPALWAGDATEEKVQARDFASAIWDNFSHQVDASMARAWQQRGDDR